jgi:hypothetical protein
LLTAASAVFTRVGYLTGGGATPAVGGLGGVLRDDYRGKSPLYIRECAEHQKRGTKNLIFFAAEKILRSAIHKGSCNSHKSVSTRLKSHLEPKAIPSRLTSLSGFFGPKPTVPGGVRFSR